VKGFCHGHFRTWPPPDGRTSASHRRLIGPSGCRRHSTPALPLEQQRNSCLYRSASRGSHVRGAFWQVRQNGFHKDGFRCGGTRARAKRVRGGLWLAVSGPISVGRRVPSRRLARRRGGVDFRRWRVPSTRGGRVPSSLPGGRERGRRIRSLLTPLHPNTPPRHRLQGAYYATARSHGVRIWPGYRSH
jgi:hypothetical protein